MNADHAEGVQSICIHRANEELASDEGPRSPKTRGVARRYDSIGHCALGYGQPAPAKERKPGRVFYIDK